MVKVGLYSVFNSAPDVCGTLEEEEEATKPDFRSSFKVR
jgi:hypothetical protein